MTETTGKYLKRVPIFVGSPSDLEAERRKFPKILEHVNAIKAKSKGVLLEPVGWEDTLPGRGRPQDKINEDLKASDLAVMLLWRRWGTPTGKYTSGFEEECEVARASGKEVWLYLRSIPDDMMSDPGEQLKKVLDFRRKVEAEGKFLFRRYQNENEWETQLTDDLCRWLDGFKPTIFELERLAEYSKTIEQLEKQSGKSISIQLDAAYALADEAQKEADSGHMTKAEESFAKALTIYPEPSIINRYALFLERIGESKKAEERFRELMRFGEATGDKRITAVAFGNIGNLYFVRGDLKAAEEMHKKALALDEELGRKQGMAGNHGNLGLVYLARDDLKAAEEMFMKALALDEELRDKEGMANAYGNLGIVYQKRGDFEAAEKMFKQALTLNEKLACKEDMAEDYGSLGALYSARGDFEAAEEMLKKALALNEELGVKNGIAETYGILGVLYGRRGDLKAAEEMLKKALALNEELGRRQGIAVTYGNLGITYQELGDLKAAEEMLKKALALNEDLGRKEGIAGTYCSLGKLYYARGDARAAEEVLKKALTIGEAAGLGEIMANAYLSLGIIYAGRGDFDDAETMCKKSLVIFTSIGNQAKVTRIKELLNKLGDLKKRK